MGLAEERKWLRSEEELWDQMERKRRDRRGFFWFAGLAALFVLARLTGCPQTAFT